MWKGVWCGEDRCVVKRGCGFWEEDASGLKEGFTGKSGMDMNMGHGPANDRLRFGWLTGQQQPWR